MSNSTHHTRLFLQGFRDYASWDPALGIPTKLLNSDVDAHIAQALEHTVFHPL